MYDVRFPYEFCCCRVFSSGAVVGAEVWEQSMSRECTSRGESEHVWGSRKEERGVKWILAPLTRGCVMKSELVKRKKEVIQRPGVSKAKLASESPEFLMRLLGLEWFISHPSEEIVNFWFTLFYFTSLSCFVRHTFFLLWKNVLGTPMMY